MNTDRIQTVLGLVEAAIIGGAGAVYAAVSSPEGFNWKSPVLWTAIVLGMIRGIKGYFAAGVKSDPGLPVAAPAQP